MLNKINHYLDVVYSQQKKLVEDRLVLIPWMGKRSLDIPPLSAEKLAIWYRIVRKNGYDGVNIGLTSLWSNTYPDAMKVIETMRVLSAHGTSVKWQLKHKKPYREALEKDKKTLDRIDPTETVPVNYDLFAGNMFTQWPKDHEAAVAENKQDISRALSLGTSPDAEIAILTYIISEVKSVYANSKRPVVFEVPGTRGWSLFPSPGSLSTVTDLVSRLYVSAKLCIDVGHLLTWKTDGVTVKDLVEMICPVAGHIGMFHISSAGSANNEFRDAYAAHYGKSFSSWHVDGLDVMLAVHEKDMIELLGKLRGMTDNILEVCETRMPMTAVADYFAGYPLDSVDNTPYYPSLELQAKLLGYIS